MTIDPEIGRMMADYFARVEIIPCTPPAMPTHLKIANWFLAPFGRRYIASFLGQWGGTHERPMKHLIFMGWRCAPRSEWEGLPDAVSEFDRFCHRQNRSEAGL